MQVSDLQVHSDDLEDQLRRKDSTFASMRQVIADLRAQLDSGTPVEDGSLGRVRQQVGGSERMGGWVLDCLRQVERSLHLVAGDCRPGHSWTGPWGGSGSRKVTLRGWEGGRSFAFQRLVKHLGLMGTANNVLREDKVNRCADCLMSQPFA